MFEGKKNEMSHVFLFPASLFPLKPQAKCLVGEGYEGVPSADVSEPAIAKNLRILGAGGSGFALTLQQTL